MRNFVALAAIIHIRGLINMGIGLTLGSLRLRSVDYVKMNLHKIHIIKSIVVKTVRCLGR